MVSETVGETRRSYFAHCQTRYSMTYSAPITPRVYTPTIAPGATEVITFLGTATFVRIDTPNTLTIKLNGSNDAAFLMVEDTYIEFRRGDMHLTSISILNTVSGATTALPQIIVGTA